MSHSNYILELEQTANRSRSSVFNQQGEMIRHAEATFKQHSPMSGWIEYDPMQIWAAQVASLEQVLTQANLDAANMTAIRITTQRETIVLWERATGLPIYNAIAAQDMRTAAYCEQLQRDGLAEMVQKKTGLPIVSNSPSTKLRWLLENINGIRARAEMGELCFGTMDSWLLWNLTSGQEHATSVSNAGHTRLYNLTTRSWDDELLKLFRIPAIVLPQIRLDSEVYGSVARGRTLAGTAITKMTGSATLTSLLS